MNSVKNLGELGVMLQRICRRLQSNQNLLKLLYYIDKDPLQQPDLTEEQIKDEIYEKLIKIVPYYEYPETATSAIVLKVNNGAVLDKNTMFLNVDLSIEVFVPMTQWIIKDTNLRPFAILGEIQRSLNGKKVDGIGTITCSDFRLNFLTKEVSCYEIFFGVTPYV